MYVDHLNTLPREIIPLYQSFFPPFLPSSPLTSKVEASQRLQCKSDIANVRVGEEGEGGGSVEEGGGFGGSGVPHRLVQQDQIQHLQEAIW